MLPEVECNEFAANQCEYETFLCRADTRSARLRCPADVLGPKAFGRLRCPADVLGPKAFVPRRPLHTLRLPLIPPLAAGRLVALRIISDQFDKSEFAPQWALDTATLKWYYFPVIII